LFPLPELSCIVVPELSSMSHVAAAVLRANAVGVPSAGTANPRAPATTAVRHHADPDIHIPLGSPTKYASGSGPWAARPALSLNHGHAAVTPPKRGCCLEAGQLFGAAPKG